MISFRPIVITHGIGKQGQFQGDPECFICTVRNRKYRQDISGEGRNPAHFKDIKETHPDLFHYVKKVKTEAHLVNLVDGDGYEEDVEGAKTAEETAKIRVITPVLRPLAFTRHIFMRITEHFESVVLQGKRHYEFFNTFGTRIYMATVVVPFCFSCSRKFETFVWSFDGHAAFKLDGNIGSLGNGAGFSVALPDDFLIGSVKQEYGSRCYLEYLILDNQKPRSILFKIKGPRLQWCCFGGLGTYTDFQIYSPNDKYIGKISQYWDRLGENFVHDDDVSFRSFGMSVPIEISANLKAVLIGVLILLDIQFLPDMDVRHEIFIDQGRSFVTHSIIICVLIFIASVYLSFVVSLNIGLISVF